MTPENEDDKEIPVGFFALMDRYPGAPPRCYQLGMSVLKEHQVHYSFLFALLTSEETWNVRRN
jgi:hypothetical protein